LEKAFLEQAAQVNVTDRELMENGEKVRRVFEKEIHWIPST
jgi:hypothetical protein